MNILFLDMDGVLTGPAIHVAYQDKGTWNRPSPVGTRLLFKLCKEQNVKLVISSTWRRLDDRTFWAHSELPKKYTAKQFIYHTLMRGGFRGSVDRWFHEDWATPVLYGKREDEIVDWLNQHPETKKWMAIDDIPLKFGEKGHTVLTQEDDGLLWRHYVQMNDYFKFGGGS